MTQMQPPQVEQIPGQPTPPDGGGMKTSMVAIVAVVVLAIGVVVGLMFPGSRSS